MRGSWNCYRRIMAAMSRFVNWSSSKFLRSLRWFSRDFLQFLARSSILKSSISRRLSAESIRHSNLSRLCRFLQFHQKLVRRRFSLLLLSQSSLFWHRALDAPRVPNEVVLDSCTKEMRMMNTFDFCWINSSIRSFFSPVVHVRAEERLFRLLGEKIPPL